MGWIYYKLLQLGNFWHECEKHKWLQASNANLPLNAVRYVKEEHSGTNLIIEQY